jgi:hypothetical protein
MMLASTEIKELTKNLAEQAEKITSNTNDAIMMLLSPFSPQHISFSESLHLHQVKAKQYILSS